MCLNLSNQDDTIAYALEQMDKHNIHRAMLGIDDVSPTHHQALKQHRLAFFFLPMRQMRIKAWKR